MGTQLPLNKCAFDQPETRAVWARARRRLTLSLTLWTAAWVMLFLTFSVLGGFADLGPAEDDVVGGVPAVTFLIYLCFLYVRVSSLRCLGRIRSVLQAHAWQPIPAARRPPDVKDVMGVPVQLRFGGHGEGHEWTGLLSARNPAHRRRWPEAMERGAWYAGARDAEGRGVLTLPGGGQLFEVGPPRV